MREYGYYWVNYYNEWEVALYDGRYWWLAGTDIPTREEYFQRIIETKLERPEIK